MNKKWCFDVKWNFTKNQRSKEEKEGNICRMMNRLLEKVGKQSLVRLWRSLNNHLRINTCFCFGRALLFCTSTEKEHNIYPLYWHMRGFLQQYECNMSILKPFCSWTCTQETLFQNRDPQFCTFCLFWGHT